MSNPAARDGSPQQSRTGTRHTAVPDTSIRPSPPDDPTVSAGEREQRRRLQERLADASYPASRNDLLRHLGPDERGPLHAHLRSLPVETVFASPEEVASSFGAWGTGG